MTKIYLAPTPTRAINGQSQVGFRSAAIALQERYASKGLDTSLGITIIMGGERPFSGRVLRLNGGKPEELGTVDDLVRITPTENILPANSLVLCGKDHNGKDYIGKVSAYLERAGREIVNLTY